RGGDPKGNGADQMRGIGLMETLWKLITGIINRRMQDSIVLHDAIHGFRRGRGCGTAIIEAKLRMQLRMRQDASLHQVFIDLSKAYDSIDRERMLQVLVAYGVGERTIRILRFLWDDHIVVPKQGRFYSDPFH